MRPTALLAAAVLFAPALAHADTIYNYAGTLYVTGGYAVLHPDGTEDDYTYNNSPFQVAVAVDLTRLTYDITSSTFHGFADNYYTFLNFLNFGSNFSNSEEVEYFDDTLEGVSGPAPTIYLSGSGESPCTYQPEKDCVAYVDDYYGTLPLVTSTPEPSTFALFGTGLLGVVGTLRKRYGRVAYP